MEMFVPVVEDMFGIMDIPTAFQTYHVGRTEKNLPLRRLGVYDIHRPVRACRGENPDSLDDTFADIRNILFLIVAQFSEDEIYLTSSPEIIADTDTDSGIVLRSEEFADVRKSVMSACTSVFSHPYGPERQVEVIGNHDQVFERQFQFGHPVSDSLSAEIHVGGRLQENEFLAFV